LGSSGIFLGFVVRGSIGVLIITIGRLLLSNAMELLQLLKFWAVAEREKTTEKRAVIKFLIYGTKAFYPLKYHFFPK
jgi:hypothetical protein